ncbi:MAG: hypothetical protein AAFU66_03025, partial [Pseudomonadota bacterium]
MYFEDTLAVSGETRLIKLELTANDQSVRYTGNLKGNRNLIRDLDGVEIDLRVYGTAGDPTTAASQARLAVNDGAQIILG